MGFLNDAAILTYQYKDESNTDNVLNPILSDFVPAQVGKEDGKISYGLSSFGYDIRLHHHSLKIFQQKKWGLFHWLLWIITLGLLPKKMTHIHPKSFPEEAICSPVVLYVTKNGNVFDVTKSMPFIQKVEFGENIFLELIHRIEQNVIVTPEVYGENVQEIYYGISPERNSHVANCARKFRGFCTVLPPYTYGLGVSEERFNMPEDVLGLAFNKSSLARTGLILNVTPLEPGWSGHLTVEFYNATRYHYILPLNEGIAQILFYKGERPKTTYADRKGYYQDQPKKVVLAKKI